MVVNSKLSCCCCHNSEQTWLNVKCLDRYHFKTNVVVIISQINDMKYITIYHINHYKCRKTIVILHQWSRQLSDVSSVSYILPFTIERPTYIYWCGLICRILKSPKRDASTTWVKTDPKLHRK